jgi:hypothetical protein
MGEVDDAEYVRNFINDRCIARVPPGSKRLPAYNNQGFYTWQFYLREALFNPRVLSIIVRDFLMQYEEHLKTGNIQLCGVESSSTPLLTGIAIACAARGYDVNIFSIRKEQKTYGRRNWIEGKVMPNKFAMLVDDIISDSHKTAIHGATILADHGIEPANCTYAVCSKATSWKTPSSYWAMTSRSHPCLT